MKKFYYNICFSMVLGAVLVMCQLPVGTAYAAEQNTIIEGITDPETPKTPDDDSTDPETPKTPDDDSTDSETPKTPDDDSTDPETPKTPDDDSTDPEDHTTNLHKIRIMALDDWEEGALTGAQLTLAKKQDSSYVNTQTEMTVTEAGLELTPDIGEYRLTVDKTPDGYITSDQPIEFQVAEDSVLLIHAENAEITEEDGSYVFAVYYTSENMLNANSISGTDTPMPSTGGGGTLPYTLVGFLLMVVAGGVLAWQGKRCK